MDFRPIDSNFQHNARGFNRILFLFSSLVDIKIGFVKYIKRYYYTSPHINKDILEMSDSDLQKFHIHDTRDLVKYCFGNKYFIDGAYDLLLEIKEDKNKYSQLLELSPVTMMVTLINAYINQGNDIKCVIACSNEVEREFIFSNLKFNSNFISVFVEPDISNIEVNEYARIVVPYAEEVTLFKDPVMRNFLILNYRENFSIDNPKQISPEVIIRVGDVNDCQYCNAYRDEYNN